MLQLDKIQEGIQQLSREEYEKLRDWFLEFDWKEWDKQIERDASMGRLDFLAEEALQEKKDAKLRTL